MDYFLRVLKKRTRWDSGVDPKLLLPTGEFVGDVLTDFETEHGSLSIWYVSGDQSNIRSSVFNIAAAFMTTKKTISTFDYILVQKSELTQFDIDDDPAETLIAAINQFHHNIRSLSIKAVSDLANIFVSNRKSLDRIGEKEIEKHFADLALKGHFKRSQLDEWTEKANFDPIQRGRLKDKIENAFTLKQKIWE